MKTFASTVANRKFLKNFVYYGCLKLFFKTLLKFSKNLEKCCVLKIFLCSLNYETRCLVASCFLASVHFYCYQCSLRSLFYLMAIDV